MTEEEYRKERAKELKEKFEKYHKEGKYGENDTRSPYEQIREIEKDMKYPLKSEHGRKALKRKDIANDDNYEKTIEITFIIE